MKKINENDFLDHFKNQFEEENIKLDLNTKFRDLDGWDSMTSMMVISMLDEEYNCIISSEEMNNFNFVGDFLNFIQTNND